MSEEKDKVRAMQDYKKVGSIDPDANIADEFRDNTGRDFGKVALFISILAVILLSIFFFGLNQSYQGLTAEVKTFTSLKGQVADMEQRLGGVEGNVGDLSAQVATLADLPEQMRRIAMSDALREISARLNNLSSQIGSDEDTERLRQAMQLLGDVEGSLAKQSSGQ